MSYFNRVVDLLIDAERIALHYFHRVIDRHRDAFK